MSQPYVIRLPSSHHTGIVSSHTIIIRRVNTVRYFDILTERDHPHISFITVCCYNCPILLLVIAVNLLLCLIYELNFIRGMYYRKKKPIYIRFSTICGFRHPLRGLEWISHGQGRILYNIHKRKNQCNCLLNYKCINVMKNQSSIHAPVQLFHLFFIWTIVRKGVPIPLQHGDTARPFLFDYSSICIRRQMNMQM